MNDLQLSGRERGSLELANATADVTVTGSGGPTYSYDANGIVEAKNGAKLIWTSFNMPSLINGSEVSSQFWYGPDRQRFKQVVNFTTGTEVTRVSQTPSFELGAPVV